MHFHDLRHACELCPHVGERVHTRDEGQALTCRFMAPKWRQHRYPTTDGFGCGKHPAKMADAAVQLQNNIDLILIREDAERAAGPVLAGGRRAADPAGLS